MRQRSDKKDEVKEWATKLFGKSDLGDVRRQRRAVEVLATLAAGAGASLPAACGHDAARYERVARYTRDTNTSPRELVSAGCTATVSAMLAAAGDIVVAGDTTTLSYAHPSVLASLGSVGGPKDAKGKGILVHSALAVSASTGEVLGLVDQMYACRDDIAYGCKHARHQRAYEDKESFKWEASFRSVWERLQPVRSRVVFVNDREADVYEYTMALVDEGARFVIRAQQDRCLETATGNLRATLATSRCLGHANLLIPEKGGRPARTARLALRGCSMTLKPPKNAQEALPPLPVHVVGLEEINAPPGIEPIRWTLLTSEPVDTLAQLLAVVTFYVLRWCIEEFHKCWKSDGTRVEDLRLQTRDNLLRIAIPMAFTAIRIMRLRDAHLHEQFQKRLPKPDAQASTPLTPPPERPCSALLSPLEWQVLWLKIDPRAPLPKQPPSLSWAMRSIAKLAGWMDTKRTGRPGYRTLWAGWTKLTDAVDTVGIVHLLNVSGTT